MRKIIYLCKYAARIFFYFFFLFSNALFAAQNPLSIKIDKTEIFPGDTFSIIVKADSDAEPVLSGQFGEFELIFFDRISADKNNAEFRFDFSVYRSGKFNVPEITIKKNFDSAGEILLQTDTSFVVTVKSTLNDGGLKPEGAVFDYEKPVLPDYDYSGIKILIFIFILSVSVIAALIFYYKKIKARLNSDIKIETIDPEPYNKLKAGLIKLKKIEINGLESSAEFSFKLSYLIREYLGGIYKINFIESSNAELNDKLMNINFYGKEDLLDILNELELIKFANRIIKKEESLNFIKITERVMDDYYAVLNISGK